jgi:hypothetical protein
MLWEWVVSTAGVSGEVVKDSNILKEWQCCSRLRGQSHAGQPVSIVRTPRVFAPARLKTDIPSRQ